MSTSGLIVPPCPPAIANVKPWWKSRTLLVNALGAIATLAAGAGELDFIKAHAKEVAFLILTVNTALRLLTTQGLSTAPPPPPPPPA